MAQRLKSLFGKIPREVSEFKKMMKGLRNTTITSTIISECTQFVFEKLLPMDDIDLKSYSIKDAFIQFTDVIVRYMVTNDRFELIWLLCLNKTSVFFYDKDNSASMAAKLILLLASMEDSTMLIASQAFLNNALTNENLIKCVTTEEFLVSIWNLHQGMPLEAAAVINSFMCTAIRSMKPHSKYDTYVSISAASLANVSAPWLSFFAVFYRVNGKNEIFEAAFPTINQTILRVRDASCYNDLLHVKTHVPGVPLDNFMRLFDFGEESLYLTLLQVTVNNEEIDIPVEPLFQHLRNAPKSLQEPFMHLVWKKSDYAKLFFPPWSFGVDYTALSRFVSEKVDKESSTEFLNLIFDDDQRELKIAFDGELAYAFIDLMVELFSKQDDFVTIPKLFEKLFTVIVNGSMGAVTCLERLCPIFPPAIFKEPMIAVINELGSNETFKKRLAYIIRQDSIFAKELLNEEFITWCINTQAYDCLAVMAISGPHRKIDQAVVANLDKFKCLSDSEKKNLCQGCMLCDEVNSHRRVRIPSLIPLLPEIQWDTLFDLSVISKYMIENKFVSINDPAFCKFGIRYITASLANEVISHPNILRDITDAAHPHQNVYQFQRGKDSCYCYIKTPVSFEFSSDITNAQFQLMQIDDVIIYIDNGKIVCGETSISLSEKWTLVRVDRCNQSSMTVSVNGKLLVTLQATEKIMIGQMGGKYETTFYVRACPSEEIRFVQIGSSVLTSKYKGFIYYCPLINGVSRILEKMMESTSESDFSAYMKALANIHVARRIYKGRSKIVGVLKTILLQKSTFITKYVIQYVLALCFAPDGSIIWDHFAHVFLDYELWMKCENVLTESISQVYPVILTDSENSDKAASSLNRFFVDLLTRCNIRSDALINLTVKTFRKQFNMISALFGRDYELADTILMKMTSIVSSIPFEYVNMLPRNAGLYFLRSLAKICIDDDKRYAHKEILKLIPYYSQVVATDNLWISLLILLTKTNKETLEAFEGSCVKRKAMVPVVLKMAVYLTDNAAPEFVKRLINILSSMDIDASGYEYEVQVLLRCGISVYIGSVLPVVTDNMDYKRHRATGSVYDLQEEPKSPDVDLGAFFDTNDLFFGYEIRNAAECIKESLGNFGAKNAREVQFSVDKLVTGPVYNFCMKLIHNMSTTRKLYASLWTFGADLDEVTSIYLHQRCVLGYINDYGISIPLLSYICDMVILGWWDTNAEELMNTIAFAVSNGMDNKQLREEFSYLVRLMLMITPVSVPDLIFDQRLLCVPGYTQFLFHVASALSDDSAFQARVADIVNEECDEHFRRKCESVFNDFKSNAEAKIQKRRSKCERTRLRSVVDIKLQQELESIHNKHACIDHINQKLFEIRYNITSSIAERQALQLWAMLPRGVPDKFQLTPSVHPLSVPTLYAPFISDVNWDNFQTYGTTEEKETPFGAKYSNTPICLDSYVRHPFFDIGLPMITSLFETMAPVTSCTSIHMMSGTEFIPCTLVKSVNEFFIVVESKAIGKKEFVFTDHNSSMIAATFFDECCAGYYGHGTLLMGHPVLHFKHSQITISTPRIFTFEEKAFEIWFASGYSLFLVFETNASLREYEEFLSPRSMLPYSKSIFSLSYASKLTKLARNRANLKEYTRKWIQNKICTFAYLLILNFFADRSFSNHIQYPVMPWVCQERDFCKPMGMQTEERADGFRDNYENTGRRFYASLYSVPAIMYRFLVRIQPFTNYHLDLQSIGFDCPERMFYNPDEEWKQASRDSMSVEELIPELFILPELFNNVNDWPIPDRKEGVSIKNCSLPTGFSNWISYVWSHRQQLNDAIGLENWLDLIFGVNSRDQNAIDRGNLFDPVAYGDTTLDGVPISKESLLSMQIHCGQVPTQILDMPHPPKDIIYHSRASQLANSDSITSQRVKIGKVKLERHMFLSEHKGGFRLQTFSDLFIETTQRLSIDLMDSTGYYEKMAIDDIISASFSCDRHIFAATLKCGTMAISCALCDDNRKIVDYKLLSMPTLPSDLITGEKATCCAVSSHVFLACEAIGKKLMFFHVSTGKFIRAVDMIGEPCDLHINDTFQIVFAVGKSFIEVFTINGTKVATYVNEDDPITCSSLSVNDVSVYIATGHESGKIVTWSVDPQRETLTPTQTLECDGPVVFVDVISHGSAIFAMVNPCEATVFCARGHKKSLFSQETAIGCAKCGVAGKLSPCSSCGLYFCKKCCSKAGIVMCQECLDHIGEMSE